MKVRSTLLSIFFITLAAFGVASGVFYTTLRRLAEVQRESVRSSEDLVRYLDLTVAVNRFAKECRDAFEGDQSEVAEFAKAKAESLAKFDSIEKALARNEGSAAQIAHDAVSAKRLKRARALFEKLDADIAELVAMRRAGDDIEQGALDVLIDRDYDHGFLEAVDEILADERAQARAHLDEADRIAIKAEVSGLTTGVSTIVLLAILVGLALRSVQKGIQDLLTGAEGFAKGDLSQRVATSGNNELSQIGDAFNRMADALVAAQREKIRAERLSAVGQAAASVGHDLRNPLAAIRNAAHYLKRRVADSDLKENERVVEFFQIIDNELDASTGIITNLLDFARDRKLASSTCAMKPLVADAISVVMAPRPMLIENLVPDDLPLLDVDKVQIRQALVNLIQNASESVPETREGRVEVTAAATAATVTLTIKDNGEGMPEARCAQIFEPFFTTKTKGTGLGLAITAGVIERHGGKIDVKSEPGAGTMISIHLPIESRQKSDSETTEG